MSKIGYKLLLYENDKVLDNIHFLNLSDSFKVALAIYQNFSDVSGFDIYDYKAKKYVAKKFRNLNDKIIEISKIKN